jgi:hypothetical protein
MPDKGKWKSWEEWQAWVEGPISKTIISEAIDYIVDFEVKETALERAQRRWGMSKKEPTQ